LKNIIISKITAQLKLKRMFDYKTVQF